MPSIFFEFWKKSVFVSVRCVHYSFPTVSWLCFWFSDSGANASSEVKSTLQRHILSKRFSANAAYAISGQHSKPSGGGAYPPNSNPSSKSPAASTFLSPPNSSLLQPPSNMSMRLPNSSCGTSNNSGGHLQMDSLDPAMLENSYSSKRLLTLLVRKAHQKRFWVLMNDLKCLRTNWLYTFRLYGFAFLRIYHFTCEGKCTCNCELGLFH